MNPAFSRSESDYSARLAHSLPSHFSPSRARKQAAPPASAGPAIKTPISSSSSSHSLTIPAAFDEIHALLKSFSLKSPTAAPKENPRLEENSLEDEEENDEEEEIPLEEETHEEPSILMNETDFSIDKENFDNWNSFQNSLENPPLKEKKEKKKNPGNLREKSTTILRNSVKPSLYSSPSHSLSHSSSPSLEEFSREVVALRPSPSMEPPVDLDIKSPSFPPDLTPASLYHYYSTLQQWEIQLIHWKSTEENRFHQRKISLDRRENSYHQLKGEYEIERNHVFLQWKHSLQREWKEKEFSLTQRVKEFSQEKEEFLGKREIFIQQEKEFHRKLQSLEEKERLFQEESSSFQQSYQSFLKDREEFHLAVTMKEIMKNQWEIENQQKWEQWREKERKMIEMEESLKKSEEDYQKRLAALERREKSLSEYLEGFQEK